MNYIERIMDKDNAFAVLIPNLPSVSYGPFTPDAAMDFLEKQNATLERIGNPNRFIAIPLVSL